MATKSFQEIKNLSPNELVAKARQLEADLFQTRIQQATGQMSDASKSWRLRKTLARVKMVIGQTNKASATGKKSSKAKG